MLEKQSGQENKSDDLDLINLFERAFSFFRNYGRLIVIFSIAGILAGFAFYKSSPKLYESTLLLHSSILSNTEQINIIENWNDLLRDGEYATLAERLNCDPAMLQKVANITVTEIQKLYISNNPNGFEVKALVKDNAVLNSLSEGIIYGLENSDYIKAKLASKRSNLAELIEKLKIEISKLDSTKKNIENSINNNSQHPSSFIIDVSAITSQMIVLNEKLLGYQDDLKFSGAVQVLHKFEKFEKPVNPKFFKLLVLGFIGGFFIGYVFSLFIYLRKRFRMHARLAQNL
jgi:LPS O-antigen subunit length determinant protein (WzzB/FepE family)